MPKALTRRQRAAVILARSALWPVWPYLPLVRRSGDREEVGVLFDFRGTTGPTGYSAAVFLVNVFSAPADERSLLALPREVYDSADEVAAAGLDID